MIGIDWKNLNPDVHLANYFPCSPNYQFGPRIIQDHQLIYVIKGSGTANIQGREYQLESGHLLYYGPNVVHTFKASCHDPFELYGLHFCLSSHLMDQNPSGAGTARIQQIGPSNQNQVILRSDNRCVLYTESQSTHSIPEFTITEKESTHPFFHNITGQYNKGGYLSSIICRTMLTDLIIRLVAPDEHPDSYLPLPSTIEDKVKMLLNSHARQGYDRRWLQEWTSYHEDYVSRLFANRFGLSPKAYFLACKLELASQMLAMTDFPISQIASTLHFGSVHYFSRIYKEKTGCSPREYRKSKRDI
ncbi:AraC family transcriptional regulator [Paenibacillus sp. J5C_2022]|uniref:AraC family transcriptional regulator n=1 Tax=Paenibacillus sp. J5C2022 TaxID=2977129 RepID=UPI0021D3ACD4|nr:AraC family transcriptional regulator [Paenibacillus sp. J5C2022]MCU6712559.1 AraC family transcriptional regulator [Paenibacillus sp. J5C2022]